MCVCVCVCVFETTEGEGDQDHGRQGAGMIVFVDVLLCNRNLTFYLLRLFVCLFVSLFVVAYASCF